MLVLWARVRLIFNLKLFIVGASNNLLVSFRVVYHEYTFSLPAIHFNNLSQLVFFGASVKLNCSIITMPQWLLELFLISLLFRNINCMDWWCRGEKGVNPVISWINLDKMAHMNMSAMQNLFRMLIRLHSLINNITLTF